MAQGRVDGEAQVRGYFAASRTPFPDQGNDVISIAADGDTVLVEFWLTGTHLGPLRIGDHDVAADGSGLPRAHGGDLRVHAGARQDRLRTAVLRPERGAAGVGTLLGGYPDFPRLTNCPELEYAPADMTELPPPPDIELGAPMIAHTERVVIDMTPHAFSEWMLQARLEDQIPDTGALPGVVGTAQLTPGDWGRPGRRGGWSTSATARASPSRC